MSTSTQCLDCKHYTGLATCDAFPDKIPQEIFDGRVIHDVSYEGDGGIMYDPIDTELSADQMVNVVKILDDKGLLKFEIPDELLEQAGIDPKKMDPKQLAAMFAKLNEKGLLNDKPADKKLVAKEPEGAQGSHPGLVKKKVTVKRNGKSSEEYRWVKPGEDEPAEKPKKGEEKPGEVPGKSPGKSAEPEKPEPEKPKGPAIKGLNKPEGEDGESEDVKGKEFMDWQPGDDYPEGIAVGAKVDIGKWGEHTITYIVGGSIIGENGKSYALTSVEAVVTPAEEDAKEPETKEKESDKAIEGKAEEISMTKDNLKSMRNAMESGLPESTHESSINLVEFKDGNKAIYKVSEELNDIVGETGFYNLSESLGWNITPQTEEVNLGHGTGTSQAFVTGDSPKYGDNDEVGIVIEEKHFDDLAKIFVMDTIVGNPDRHFQNVMINEDGKCWAIDNDTWTENNSMYDADKAKMKFDNLQYHCDNKTGSSWKSEAFTDWLQHSLDADGFKKFKSVVDDKLTEILKHKGNIESYYKTTGEVYSIGAMDHNIEQAEKYLSEQKI